MRALQSDLYRTVAKDEEKSELLRKILCGEAPNSIEVDGKTYIVCVQLSERLQKI